MLGHPKVGHRLPERADDPVPGCLRLLDGHFVPLRQQVHRVIEAAHQPSPLPRGPNTSQTPGLV
jgi:hypothetical protein